MVEDVRERLTRLRAAHGQQRYASDRDATGADPARLVTMTVDATGWVRDVRVEPYDQAPRADELAGAVLLAYVAADVQRLRDCAVASGRDVEAEAGAAEAGRARRPVPRLPRSFELRTDGEPSSGPARLADPSLATARLLDVPGSDEAGRVRVVLSGGGALRTVVLDDPWLERARPERVTTALRSALEQAYGRLS